MTAADGERELLRRTVEELLARHCTPARVAAAAAGAGWDAGLWQALEETGLTLAGSPEEAGGSGGDLLAAADIAVAAGAAAAPVPLAETLAAGSGQGARADMGLKQRYGHRCLPACPQQRGQVGQPTAVPVRLGHAHPVHPVGVHLLPDRLRG